LPLETKGHEFETREVLSLALAIRRDIEKIRREGKS
jgi:hypothetical protein